MWEYGDLKQEYEWYNEVRNLKNILLPVFDNFQNFFFDNFYKILPERPILFVAATLNVYSVLALRLECSNVS